MAAKGNRKKTTKKRHGKSRRRKKGFIVMLRQWSLPLCLLLLIGFSLAATFYIIFLHAPSTPLF